MEFKNKAGISGRCFLIQRNVILHLIFIKNMHNYLFNLVYIKSFKSTVVSSMAQFYFHQHCKICLGGIYVLQNATGTKKKMASK